MRLRRQLQKRLPVNQGEVQLSPITSRAVFTGSYVSNRPITGAEKDENLWLWGNRSSTYPYRIFVKRTKNNGAESYISNGGGYTETGAEIVTQEMENPMALARANRVEKVARRVKLSVGGLLVVGLAVGGVVHHVSADNLKTTPDAQIEAPNIKPCADVVTGVETLVPVEPQNHSSIQKAGGTICTLANMDYLVVN